MRLTLLWLLCLAALLVGACGSPEEDEDKPKPTSITPGVALAEPLASANAAIEPTLAYDGTRVHLVYCQNTGAANHNVVYSQRVGGGPFSAPAPLFPTSTNDSRRPHAVLDSAGTLHVVWVEGTAPNRDVFYVTRSATGVISTESNLSNTVSGDENNPRIHADVTGRIHVVWEGTSGLTSAIFYRRTVGSVFAATQTLPFTTSGISGEMPDVGVDVDQHVYVVWAENVGPNRVIRMMRSDDNGTTFGDINGGIAVGGSADKTEPRIACGDLGEVILTFVAQNMTGERALFVTHTQTGGTFAGPGQLFSSTTGGVRSPSIARFKQSNGDRIVMIAFNDGPAVGGNTLVIASRDGGQNWPNDPVDLSASNSQPATNRTPAVAMDDNEVVVAWAAQPTGGGVVTTFTSSSTYSLP